jgi:hypothetical protein
LHFATTLPLPSFLLAQQLVLAPAARAAEEHWQSPGAPWLPGTHCLDFTVRLPFQPEASWQLYPAGQSPFPLHSWPQK